MQSKHKSMAMVVGLSLLATGFTAFAAYDYYSLSQRGQERSIAMERIREHVLREFPGEMINARVTAWRGRTLYRIHMADENTGKRVWLSYDVDTGERVEPKF